MRVVIDTNALVSRLLLAQSVPARAVDRALKGMEVVVSEATVEELADVLAREKWNRYVSVEDRQEFIRRLLQICTLVPVLSEIDDCPDPADNRFLALALDVSARVIVTGDRDLLALHPWRGVEILTPAEFLGRFPE
jgi:putative PIN family toxin of toxin-antitoxin system